MGDQRYFYVFGSKDGTEIKIGSAIDPRDRKKDLERDGGYGQELVDLFFFRGWSNSKEESLKKILFPFRSRERSQEHYRATLEIRDWLRFLWQQPFTGSSIKPADIEELQVCDNVNAWFPFMDGHSVALEPPVQAVFGGFDDVPMMKKGHLDGTTWSDLDTDHVQEGDYYLPEIEIKMVHEMWIGGPDLDVASCKAANRTVRAKRFYGAHQKGETKPWARTNIANPPFDFWPEFYAHLLEEMKSGRAQEILAVYPMDKLGTVCGQSFLRTANAACFRKGEVVFEGPLISKRTQRSHLKAGAYKNKLDADLIPADDAEKTVGDANKRFQTSGRLRIVYFYFGPDTSVFSKVFGAAGAVLPVISPGSAGPQNVPPEIEPPEDFAASGSRESAPFDTATDYKTQSPMFL